MRKIKLKVKKIMAVLLAATIMASLFVAPVGAVTMEPIGAMQAATASNLQTGTIAALNFATPNGITVSANPASGGTAVSAPATQAVPGATVTITATPAAGYTFVRWDVITGTVYFANANSAQTTFIMPGTAVAVAAVFQSGTGRNVVVQVGPTTGTGAAGGRAGVGINAAAASTAANGAAANTGGRLDNAPATVNLHAIPAAGQTFSRWVNVAGGGTILNPESPTTTFTVPGTGTGDITIRAEFGPTRTVTVQRNNDAWGTASADQTSTAHNRRINLTASPASGFTFLHWEIVGSPPAGFSNESIANRTSATNAHFTMPNGNVTVRAVFQSGTQSVTVTTNNITGATAVASAPNVSQGTSIVVSANQTVTVSATPPSGYALANWEVIGSPPSGFSNTSFANRFDQSTTFTMPSGSVQIRANFATGHRVQVQSNNINLGTVTQNTGAAANGATVTITANPTSGNRFVRWEAVTPANLTFANAENSSTTFTMPNSGVTVRAIFEASTLSITASGGISVDYTISGGSIILQLPTARVNEILTATAAGSIVSLDMRHLGNVFSATLPREALTQLANANRSLELRFAGGTRVFTREQLTALASASTATNITLDLNTVIPGTEQPRENPFTDVRPDQWFFENVLFVYNAGLMGGTATNPPTFSPNMNLNRAMIVTILHRQEGTPTPTGANPFSDVPAGQWFTEAVIWAAENNIVAGYQGRFNPLANITRQDLAVILMRYADFKNMTLPTVNTYTGFNDSNRISGYAVEAVQRSFAAGIITGQPGNNFAPLANATRAETAAMLHRFFTA